MDFTRLAAALAGETTETGAGKAREVTSFVVKLAAAEVAVHPDTIDGACVGAVFVVRRADAADLPRIVLRREDRIDRGGKALGISREIQVGDPDFDATVYIESEAPEAVVRRALAPAEARGAALALVRGPAGAVEIGEGRAVLRLGEEALAGEPAAILAALAPLATLGASFAVPGELPGRAELVGRRSVRHIFVIALAWLALLVPALMLRPPVVLTWGSTLAALGVGLLVWLLSVVGLGLLLRGGADSLRWLGISAAVFLLTAPAAGLKLALLANARLDEGAASASRRAVKLVDETTARIFLEVEELGGVAVPKAIVRGALPERPTSLVLVTRPGAFGWAWIEEVRP